MAKQDPPKEPTEKSAPRYTITGLKPSAHMPISFGGNTYDLANLTEDQLAHLLKYPEQVPYLSVDEPQPPAK